MKKYERLENLDNITFKRIVGVKRSTYKEMLSIYKKSELDRKSNHKIGGRKPKLCEEDRVLFMLEYYREYRTLAHMGLDYGISEGQASKLVRNVEQVLIRSGKFSLPSKRSLYQSDNQIEFIIIDATESPIQRPKKNNESIIQEKRNAILKNHK